MNESLPNQLARYEQIALMIANDISRGSFAEGERISGRSVLAGRYGVSPETIRKALSLLEEQQVAKTVQGSGVYILSREAARNFAANFQERNRLEHLLQHLKALIKERNKLNAEIEKLIQEIVLFKSSILKGMHKTEEIMVMPSSSLIGKSVYETQLRTVTGANVIAIWHNGRWHLSPGRKLLLKAGDILLVTGSNKALSLLRRMAENKTASAE